MKKKARRRKGANKKREDKEEGKSTSRGGKAARYSGKSEREGGKRSDLDGEVEKKETEEREGGPPNARHNPTRLRLLRWILKDPRDYYFFPFLLVFILLLLFQRRCERACTSDGAHVHWPQWPRACASAGAICAHTFARIYNKRERMKEREDERERKGEIHISVYDEKVRRYRRGYERGDYWLRVLYTRPRMTLARLGEDFHRDYRRALKLTVTEVTLGLGQRSLPFRACSISFSAKF